MTPECEILIGDVRAKLKELKARGTKVQCVVTSPPYWGLRDYGTPPVVWGGSAECDHDWGEASTRHRGGPQGQTGDRSTRDTSAQDKTGDFATGQFCRKCGAWLGQLGLEPTPQLFVEHMVEVFDALWDVLADDGVCWLNLGDCYSDSGRGPDVGSTLLGSRANQEQSRRAVTRETYKGLKPKNVVGQPWRVAFALQDRGWTLRQDIIWEKPNPMPESVTDRCTKAHEYLFLLTKRESYYYNADAIKEPASPDSHARYARGRSDSHKWADGGPLNQTIAKSFDHMLRKAGEPGVNPKANGLFPSGWDSGKGRAHRALTGRYPKPKQNASFSAVVKDLVDMRNKRSVWTIPTEPYSEAHYATFPRGLVRPCILAGSRPGDVVLDPFGGSGTVGEVALEYGRNSILIDLNAGNEALMLGRMAKHAGQGVLAI